MYVRRSDWNARRAAHRVPRLEARAVKGLALHWPGDGVHRDTPEEVMASLRAWQAQHIDGNDWSDIAYQEAVDQAGNVYRLRGLRYRSAANGDEDTNDAYGAVLLVLAIDERPSAAMVTAVQRVVKRHRDAFPHSTKVVPHSAIRPGGTECPGDHVRRLIDSGAFEPTATRGKR